MRRVKIRKEKVIKVYSMADWKFHRDKLGYDDLIDENGKDHLTIAVADALYDDEVLADTYLESRLPEKLFIEDRKGGWSVYLKVRWLTPQIVQQTLEWFGGLAGKRFQFEPHRLPEKILRRHRARVEEWRREAEEATRKGTWTTVADLRKVDKKPPSSKPDRVQSLKDKKKKMAKRLFLISTHKMKDLG